MARRREVSEFEGLDAYRTARRVRRSVVSGACRRLGLPFLLYPASLKIIFAASARATLGRYGGPEWSRSSLAYLDALERAGVSFEITGLDNVRRLDRAAVFISNHMSTLETFVLPFLIQTIREVTFVVKRSLTTMPVFGPVMRSRDPVVVDRLNPREDYATVMEEGARRLGEGRSVIVFPQSTRSEAFVPADFNSLGVKLARRAGSPILPVALRTDAWLNGRRLKDFGPLDPGRPVYFSFGEPMEVSGTGAEEHRRIVAFIREKVEAWGAPVL